MYFWSSLGYQAKFDQLPVWLVWLVYHLCKAAVFLTQGARLEEIPHLGTWQRKCEVKHILTPTLGALVGSRLENLERRFIFCVGIFFSLLLDFSSLWPKVFRTLFCFCIFGFICVRRTKMVNSQSLFGICSLSDKNPKKSPVHILKISLPHKFDFFYSKWSEKYGKTWNNLQKV